MFQLLFQFDHLHPQMQNRTFNQIPSLRRTTYTYKILDVVVFKMKIKILSLNGNNQRQDELTATKGCAVIYWSLY